MEQNNGWKRQLNRDVLPWITRAAARRVTRECRPVNSAAQLCLLTTKDYAAVTPHLDKYESAYFHSSCQCRRPHADLGWGPESKPVSMLFLTSDAVLAVCQLTGKTFPNVSIETKYDSLAEFTLQGIEWLEIRGRHANQERDHPLIPDLVRIIENNHEYEYP